MEKVEVTPVIGLPQVTGWSHVVTNRERTLTCAFAIEGLHASNVGRDVADELEHLEPENAAAFYSFLTRLHREVTQKECTLYLAAALLLNGKGVFIGLNGSIVLHRQQKLGKVVQASDMFQVIEGTWQSDDFFILLTAPATNLLNEIEQKIRQGFDQDTVIASLVPSVHMIDNSSLHALAFVRKLTGVISEETQPESETPGFAIDVEVGEVTPGVEPVTPPSPSLVHPLSLESAEAPNPERVATQPAAIAVTDSEPVIEQLPPREQPVERVIPSSPTTPATPQPTLRERLQPTLAVSRKLASGAGLLLGRVGHLFLQPFSRVGRPFSGEVYVTSLSGRKIARRVVPIILIVLLAVGGASYYFYQRRTARTKIANELQQISGRAEELRAQASTDPIGTRVAMNEILSNLRDFKENAPSNYGIPTLIDTRITEVQQAYDEISGMEEINALDPFFDLRLVASDFVANDMVMVEDQLVLVDSGKKQLITLNLPNKEYQTISLEDRESVVDLTAATEDVVVLAGGVYRYPISGGGAEQVIANDDQVKTASRVVFFNDAYYVVNPEKQNIFRYRPNDEGKYEIAVGWVRPGEAIDFNQLQSVAIDGDFWLGTKEGKIHRYNSGRQQTFEPTGLTTAFSGSLWVMTNENVENIYVLESDHRRLVILTKNGEFLREIQSSSLATATGLVVSDDEKSAYVISGSLVYQLPL